MTKASLKMFDSIESLIAAQKKGIEEYQKLLQSTVPLLYLASDYSHRVRQKAVLDGLTDSMGIWIKHETPENDAKDFAGRVLGKIEAYRAETPQSLVDVLNPGLKMLEEFCRKYI